MQYKRSYKDKWTDEHAPCCERTTSDRLQLDLSGWFGLSMDLKTLQHWSWCEGLAMNIHFVFCLNTTKRHSESFILLSNNPSWPLDFLFVVELDHCLLKLYQLGDLIRNVLLHVLWKNCYMSKKWFYTLMLRYNSPYDRSESFPFSLGFFFAWVMSSNCVKRLTELKEVTVCFRLPNVMSGCIKTMFSCPGKLESKRVFKRETIPLL